MKKLINSPASVVEDLVHGLISCNPGLARLDGHNVVVRKDLDTVRHNVALVSGGGSGHEPAHAGYLGEGMLSAAVLGDVFTSPSTEAVLAAIRVVAGPKGALLIVKNYTGDRLNFGLAAQRARAEGIPAEIVVVADDVALYTSTDNAGRRGIAGTAFVHKVAGAAAQAGLSLEAVKALAQQACDAVATMGVALAPCTVPAAGKPSFSLGDDEVELGLGIHGEAGVRKEKIKSAKETVDTIMTQICAERNLGKQERVALLVNNLGGTPTMEVLIAGGHAADYLKNRGVNVERVIYGTFMSALEMAGISLTVFQLDKHEHFLQYLDAPTTAPGWPNLVHAQAVVDAPIKVPAGTTDNMGALAVRSSSGDAKADAGGAQLTKVLNAVIEKVVSAEQHLTDLDNKVGDGDLGINLANIFGKQIRGALDKKELAVNNAAVVVEQLGLLVQLMGGTSGPLYAILFLTAARVIKESGTTQTADVPASLWAKAATAGCDALMGIGGAKVGDRTMVDALKPGCDALENGIASGMDAKSAATAAAKAAEAGSQQTAEVVAKKGRSSYLGNRALGVRDPGADAIAMMFKAIADAL